MKTLKKLLTAALATALLLSAMVVPAGAYGMEELTPVDAAVYADLDPNAYYYESVNAVCNGGLIKGFPDGAFHPDSEVTYAELITILARISGLYCVPDEHSSEFLRSQYAYGLRIVNMSQNGGCHWASPALDRIEKAFRVDSGGTVVCPEDLDCTVPRAHALDLIYRMMVYLSSNHGHTYTHSLEPIYSYTEADIPDWDAVQGERNVKDLNIYYIDDEMNYLPFEMIYQFSNSSAPSGYDMDSIQKANPAMKPYVFAHPDRVLAAYNLGITSGVDENHTCAPLSGLTRAELCVMLHRVELDHRYVRNQSYNAFD